MDTVLTKNRFKQFISPHSHSDGSIDGASTVAQIIDRNIELGANYVTMTEHGNINTAMELYTLCKKKGVKPILGIELYVRPTDSILNRIKQEYVHFIGKDGLTEQKIDKKLKEMYTHLIVHFKDEESYNYFCKLSPVMDDRAVVRYGERKPICTIEELQAISGHITIGSACILGFASRWFLPDRVTGKVYPDIAEEAYNVIREIAGPGNFFVEVMPHELTHNWVAPEKDKDSGKIKKEGYFKPIEKTDQFPDGDLQKKVNQEMIALAKKYNDPVMISLDSHFALPKHKVTQDSKLSNGQQYQKYYVSYHIHPTDEVADFLIKSLGVTEETIEQWVDNSYKWAALFDNFKITTNENRWVLTPLSAQWKTDLKSKIDRHGRMDWTNKEMVTRLRYEIDVLTNNGRINLLTYFFTVEDIADFCRKNDILINVRGSASGSLLLYLLGVSAINPLLHDLSFERFLTLGRIKANTLPDVDIDISDRDTVLSYLESKYGDAFCQLSTDSMLKLKSSIKDAERAISGVVSGRTEKMCKELPFSPQGVNERDVVFGYEDDSGHHIQGLIETNPKLVDWIKINPEIWEMASTMLGIQRQKSVHACGVLIADKPIQEYCPIITVSKTKATGYSPKWAEYAGLVKYDLLGLNTLRDIQNCLKSIRERTGEVIDPWHLAHDDKIFDAFCKGKTETVFQFNTQTVIPYLKKIKPKNIEDLSMITALCRPGTLDSPYGDGRMLSEVFVDRRNGEPIEYIHPDLEPILKDTMGIQLYQELTLKIFRDLAGYSYEKAEMVRRAIGKKDEAILRECVTDLKTACLTRGWTDYQASLLVDQIMASSRYSFNKSHAISYSYVAYACMYLKEKYPLDWWKGCLINASKDELAANFWTYVRDFTLLPDINKSKREYSIEGDKLRAPISIINGIGPKAYDQLVSNAPYSNLYQFVKNHFGEQEDNDRSSVHTGIAHKLIAAGVLDSLYDDQGLRIDEKIERFETIKASIKNKKGPDPVPSQYLGISALGKYLIKKELIKVYSEDLRPLMLPPRGGRQLKSNFWMIDGRYVISANQISIMKQEAADGLGFVREVSCLAYVIDEKPIIYKNKTKQATKLFLDASDDLFEEVLWPSYGENTALSGYKGLPVLLIYNSTQDRFSLKTVVPLIQKNQLGDYSVI